MKQPVSEMEEPPSKFSSLVKALWPFAKKTKPVYNLKTIRTPRTSGKMLKFFSLSVRIPGLRSWIFPVMLQQMGFYTLRKSQVQEAPLLQPVLPVEFPVTQEEAEESIQKFLEVKRTFSQTNNVEQNKCKPSLFHPETITQFHKAYLENETNPVDVTLRLLDVIRSVEESAVPMRPLFVWDEKELMRQAKESAARYEKGEPLSLLDGVPVSVKDEMDMLPFRTMMGAKIEDTPHPTEDATIVARIREAGAIMIGKTNMHELGGGVTGLNTNYGTARNPYHLDHFPGGSSSGSAASVAAGLCPVSLAVDGGGSIRIPASLCGLVGLKSTWGRISSKGAAPLSWSVATVGPIASSVDDCALAYQTMAGPDSEFAFSQNQPPLDLQRYHDTDLQGVRLGYFKAWNQHSSKDIQKQCEKTIEQFKKLGCQIVEVELPEMQEAYTAHIVTIVTEWMTSLKSHVKWFNSTFGTEVYINLLLASQIKAHDYIRAQRQRKKVVKDLHQVFSQVDAIISPTTAITAPRIHADVLEGGEMDIRTFTELTRFSLLANLSGFPAITFPAGYDSSGLPIGVQLMGRPWEESMLFRLAKSSENFFCRQPPMMRFSLLPDGKVEN